MKTGGRKEEKRKKEKHEGQRHPATTCRGQQRNGSESGIERSGCGRGSGIGSGSGIGDGSRREQAARQEILEGRLE